MKLINKETSIFHSFGWTRKGFVLLFLFLPSLLFSQTPLKRMIIYKDPTIHSFGVRTGFGVIIPHRESMIHLITGHVASIEVFAEKAGTKRVWNQYYSYPTSGVILFTGFLGNPDVLGNAFALDYFTNMHLIKKSKGEDKTNARFMLDMRMSAGMGYLTKTFDPDINNHNVAIGSRLNISVGLSFDMKWRINWATQFFAGLSLRHFSNGSFTTPNLGINIPSLTIGVKKNIALRPVYQREYVIQDSTRNSFNRKKHFPHHDFMVIGGLGIKEIYPAGGEKFGVYSLEFCYSYHNSHRSALSAGMDVFHNVALYQHAIKNDTVFSGVEKDITQYAVNIGYTQVFDKFELFLQSGIYLVSKYKKDGAYYQRLGGRYIFNERWIAQFALKTHFAKADYFEIGVGYNFRKKIIPKYKNVEP